MVYTMQPPDELMVRDFLPAMRQLVAQQLRSQGLSQTRISALLGVTQASVSLYLASDAKKAHSALARLSVSKSVADRYASHLAADVTKGPADGVGTLDSIWKGLLGSGAICPAHRSLYPELADCDVCIKLYGLEGGEKSLAVSDVADAVRLIEGSPDFVALIPEVSVNIACATPDAATPADVIAVPGRIVRVKGRAKALLPPEAGASIHMSKVLLAVRRRRPAVRACINLRYDSKVASAMKSMGLRTLSVGNHHRTASVDPTVDAIQRRLRGASSNFDAIVDLGGSGVEPNVYLFAESAKAVTALALKVARVYSES